MSRLLRLALIGLLLTAAPAAARQPAAPLTHAERIGWTGLTPHDSVVAFYHRLAALTPDVRVGEAGRSRLGRPLLLVTLSRPSVAQPWAAHASGRPIVFISAQVHGDEPAGKEGLMLLARDLALGPLRPLLDHMVFVLIPQVNPDGAEARTWGTRANAAGYNINRDYLRLANPETHAVVAALAAWRPHVVIDAHELTGPREYDFYTLHPTTLNAPPAVVRMASGSLTTAVRTAVEAAGFTWFPYHIQPSDPTRIESTGLLAAEYGGRTLRGYGGEQAAVTLLFESKRDRASPDARVAIEPRARMQRVALEAVARFAADSAQALLATVRAARARTGDSVVVQAEPAPSAEVAYRMPEMRRAGDRFEPTGRILDLRVPLRDSAAATLIRPRPVAYLVEAHRSDLADALAAHGLVVERLTEAGPVRVEAFRLDSVRVADLPYEGYLPRAVHTTLVPGSVDARAGAWLVRTDQPNAAILFSLVEPESADSFATLGAFLAEERVGEWLPIYRLVELPGLARTLR